MSQLTENAPALDAAQADAPSILSKAFDVLRAFNAQQRVLTLSELARASGLPKSTVHRLLARLVELGVVEHHRSGYKIGLSLLQLGSSTPAGYMRDLAMPYLAKLHRWSGQTVHFAVLRQYEVVYLEKFATTDTRASINTVGSRLPANCTAIGKAMLAHENLDDLAAFLPSPLPAMTVNSITDVDTLIDQLRHVRAEGVAREHEEVQLGLACIAAPLIMRGFAVGGVSLAFPADAPPPAQASAALTSTAAEIVNRVKEGLAAGRDHWFPREI
jgi:DNA-binding IclR family transcriptional regulator